MVWYVAAFSHRFHRSELHGIHTMAHIQSCTLFLSLAELCAYVKMWDAFFEHLLSPNSQRMLNLSNTHRKTNLKLLTTFLLKAYSFCWRNLIYKKKTTAELCVYRNNFHSHLLSIYSWQALNKPFSFRNTFIKQYEMNAMLQE